MVSRRAAITGGAAMAGMAGLGGLNPKPVNAPAGAVPASGVQPGQSSAVVVANRVIVFGPNGGVFVYSSTPASGNLIASIAGAAGSDRYGNAYLPGVVSYFQGAGVYLAIQMYHAQIAFWWSVTEAGPWTQTVTVQGDANKNLTVSAANITITDTVDGITELIGLRSGANFTAVNMLGADVVTDLGHFFRVQDPATPNNTPQVEGWHTMTPGLNPGFAAGGTTPQYRLMPDGTVRLRGAVNLTAAQAANAIFFALPTGYIPSTGQDWATHNTLSGYTPAAGSLPSSVAVTSAGHLSIFTSGAPGNFVVLDGIVITL